MQADLVRSLYLDLERFYIQSRSFGLRFWWGEVGIGGREVKELSESCSQLG